MTQPLSVSADRPHGPRTNVESFCYFTSFALMLLGLGQLATGTTELPINFGFVIAGGLMMVTGCLCSIIARLNRLVELRESEQR